MEGGAAHTDHRPGRKVPGADAAHAARNNGQAPGEASVGVPDRPVNAEYMRSLPDSQIHRLTCRQAGGPAAQTDLLSWRSNSRDTRQRFNVRQVRDRLSMTAGAGRSLAAPVTSWEQSSPGDARWRTSEHMPRSLGLTIR
jgi:hypothetical protein